MTRYIYPFEKHFGGMSQDEYVWPLGCFYDAEWVEVRRNSKEVTLNKSVTNWASIPVFKTGTNQWEITAWNKKYQSSSNYGFLAGTSLGYMYDASWRTTNQYSSDNYAILNIGTYTITSWGTTYNYGFYINERGGLYRWTYDITSSSCGILGYTLGSPPVWFTFVNSSYPTTNRWPAAPYDINNGLLIYACADKIFCVDVSTTTWAVLNTITLDSGYVVKWMTRIDSQFIIYAANDTVTDNTGAITKVGWAKWKAYYLSLGAIQGGQTWERSITWNDRPVLWVINRNNEDFVVAGTPFRRFIFQNAGAYNPTTLYQSKITTDNTERFFFDPKYGTSCINVWQIMLIPAYESLYTYWNIIPWLGESILKEFKFTGYTPISLYLDETGSSSDLYVWLRKNSETSPSYNAYYTKITLTSANPNYVTSGYVTENAFVGNWQREKKQTCKYEVAYYLEANSTIQVYASVDDWAFTLLNTISDTTVRRFVWVYGWDFYKIQFKIVLNTSTGNSTPHFYSLRAAYDTTRDEMS